MPYFSAMALVVSVMPDWSAPITAANFPRKDPYFLPAKDWHGTGRSANPVALYGRRIELDAEARPLGQQHVAGLELERRLEELGAQLVVAHVVFEHLRPRRMVGVRRGGQRRDEMAGRCEAHRAAPDVRRHAQVGRLGQHGDALGLGQAA